MEKKLKRKWVKALESGKFRRARGRLKDGPGYCCLGVLCKVAGVDFAPDEKYLPSELADVAKLSKDEQNLLAKANDGDLDDAEEAAMFPRYRYDNGAPFKSIAKYIREKL